MDQVINLLQEVARDYLEACEAAIRAADQATAVSTLERAFAKLDTAIDMLRAQSRPG